MDLGGADFRVGTIGLKRPIPEFTLGFEEAYDERIGGSGGMSGVLPGSPIVGRNCRPKTAKFSKFLHMHIARWAGGEGSLA
jgi:hypothetical protein